MRAVDALRLALGPLRVASLYESPALLPPEAATDAGAAFLNTAVVIPRCPVADPDVLLALAKHIEVAAGRRRGRRWAPRVLDIDLLLVGAAQRRSAALTVPHPGLAERRFVLTPLAEIAPDLPVPSTAHTVATLLDALPIAAPAVTRRPWPTAAGADRSR